MKFFTEAPFAGPLVKSVNIGSFKVSYVFLPLLAELVADKGYDEVAAQILSKKEMARLLSFASEKRRYEWLGGRMAAKDALVICLADGSLPEDIEILVEENGRPYVVGGIGKRPYISISHSGEYAVAVAVLSPCGIDVQAVKQTLVRVVDRFASSKEQEMLAMVLPTDWPQAKQLALLWSAKEAVRKMIDIEPLLGFSEMGLVAIKGVGGAGGLIDLEFSCDRVKEDLPQVRVMVVAEDDYMLALTCLDSK